jgi:stage III sporulation protein SpoIIIAA
MLIIDKDLNKLINIFPSHIRSALNLNPSKQNLIEIILDLGRKPEARFISGPELISEQTVSWQDLDYCVNQLGNFSDDNRAGIERTLHRISCIRNRQGAIIGLTCRVGRSIYGTITAIRDLIQTGKSILVLGKPGVGKTTVIREMARILSDEMEKRVVIIDTSNEIAGDSDIPHVGIGRARRMQVSKTELQHQVMIEAVENHMPEVIIIDEIGTEAEALAAKTIGERGVQLIGTAHGNDLESLLKNPVLTDLIGGVQYVTLSDDEARRRSSQKSIQERKAPPAFELAIEINERENWIVHQKVDDSVDSLLQGYQPTLQSRIIDSDYKKIVQIQVPTKTSYFNIKRNKIKWRKEKIDSKIVEKKEKTKLKNKNQNKTYYFYSYSLSKSNVLKNANILNFNIKPTTNLNKIDFILALESAAKNNRNLKKISKQLNLPIVTVKNNTVLQIIQTLYHMLKYGILKDCF